MKKGGRRRTGKNVAEMESAEMQSCRHVSGGVAYLNLGICANPNRPGTGDRAIYIFNKVVL